MEDDYDRFEPDIPDGHVLCPRCDGHQEVTCRCGGDQCYCDNNGDMPCPLCGGEYGGEGYVSKEVYDRWWETNKKWHVAFKAGLTESN
jgi:hypothetical protein